jgi:hypothetical protein
VNKKNVIEDEAGNKLIINGNRISLKFANEQYARLIGVINLENRFMFVLRTRKKHLFKKLNAYGFCYRVISEAKKFDYIKIADEFGTYLIPRKVMLDRGEFLHFKKQGFELQIFLNIHLMNRYKLYNEDYHKSYA